MMRVTMVMIMLVRMGGIVRVPVIMIRVACMFMAVRAFISVTALRTTAVF